VRRSRRRHAHHQRDAGLSAALPGGIAPR
jgi:hypothetical protein